jgi:uncharacterized protein YegL
MTMPEIQGMLRRLPVYFLLDCSEAMAGAPLAAVQHLLEEVHHHLLDDPQTRETAYISLIRFSEMAAQDALADVDSFVVPVLTTAQGRSFGAALRILRESLRDDLIPSTEHQRGDYHPVVFALLGGPPTDSYALEVQALRLLTGPQRPSFVGMAEGHSGAAQVLRGLTDEVMELGAITPEALRPLFLRARSAIITTSRGMLPTANQSPPAWLGNPLQPPG